MKKLIAQLIALSLTLLSLFALADYVFTYFFQKGNYTKVQWLYKIKDQNFDYAIHGSSRAYTNVNVTGIDTLTHLNGINIAVDGSNITEQYLVLKLLLQHNNKFKQLFLQVDPWSLNKMECSAFAIPKFMPYLKEEEVFNHFKSFGNKWYAYRYIPFLRYAVYNSVWGIHEVLNDAFSLLKPDFDNKGCFSYPNVKYKGAKELRESAFDLTAEYVYLNKIIALCKTNNIKLILFTAPIANLKQDAEYFRNVNSFSNLMCNKNVKYVNYGNLYRNNTDMFYDEIHLNKTGSESFTNKIKEVF